MAILVTGGAGYIGSAMVDQLVARNEQVVVLDDLRRGHRAAVGSAVPFYQGQVGNRSLVKSICNEHKIDSCIHFAALAYVGESVTSPDLYFENNVEQGFALLQVLRAEGVRRFVFSSTCATYGEPQRIPIDEAHPQAPTNPYGWSKLLMEKILQANEAAFGLKFVALRYFNAAGATARTGEHHEPESHLIPNVLAAALGKLPQVQVFGNDYATPDGTAIRDYIHISDLCAAHLLALEHLRKGGTSDFLNLGTGHGYSVSEVIAAARQVTGCDIEMKIEPRRAGDPSRLVADASKAASVLGWKPKCSDLESIIRSAWEWHRTHPQGYAAEVEQ
jgi:UDP-glucose 4-epimerase